LIKSGSAEALRKSELVFAYIRSDDGVRIYRSRRDDRAKLNKDPISGSRVAYRDELRRRIY
jgi:hypothetical protein